YVKFFNGETQKLGRVERMATSPSRIYARMLIRYDKPPIYEEEWRMQDIEGISTYEYLIRSYDGKQITITAPPHQVYDVSFFWGKLDQDGVWQIVNQPPRGDTSATYTVYAKQVIDYKQGERTVTFTDPQYWAVTAGRQYTIDLSKSAPKDLLKMQSTQLANAHYQMVVDDFLNFGPPEFRAKIAQARARLRAGK
ncbi:MAG TPA: hypothetical protein VNF68_03140, partial [Candidatus Baltobacteraceae bacterium]|nr:hypothetical protein [Candidatus Baltobacteraceae bacterium]